MGKVFDFLGTSTGCITSNLEDSERKKIIIAILHMALTTSWDLTI